MTHVRPRESGDDVRPERAVLNETPACAGEQEKKKRA